MPPGYSPNDEEAKEEIRDKFKSFPQGVGRNKRKAHEIQV